MNSIEYDSFIILIRKVRNNPNFFESLIFGPVKRNYNVKTFDLCSHSLAVHCHCQVFTVKYFIIAGLIFSASFVSINIFGFNLICNFYCFWEISKIVETIATLYLMSVQTQHYIWWSLYVQIKKMSSDMRATKALVLWSRMELFSAAIR